MKLLGMVCSLCGLMLAVQSSASSAPLRHVVYNFTVSVRSNLTIHDSGIGSTNATGSDAFGGTVMDRGTIAIDVLQAARDGGLSVQIREDAQNTRTAKPATCAVYGDGRVICDPQASVNPEEQALLLAFGRGFVDPSKFDAKNHWRQSAAGSGYSTASDYTVASGDVGGVVTIVLQRTDKMGGPQGYDAVTDGTITYNVPLSVPVGLKEDTIMRQSHGIGQDNRVDTSVTLALASDSMQPASH